MKLEDHPHLKEFGLVPWAMFIDIEGFSHIYLNQFENDALMQLRKFSRGLKKIFDAYDQEDSRLFVHGIGDGFLVLPDFGDPTLERPLSIAMALMQNQLLNGGILKVGISWGTLADIQGVYPDQIRQKNLLQRGIFRLWPVMGDALIRSHQIANSASGPLLIVDNDVSKYLPNNTPKYFTYSKWLEMDWLADNIPLTNSLLPLLLGVRHNNLPQKNDFKDQLRRYISLNKSLSKNNNWIKSANTMLSM